MYKKIIKVDQEKPWTNEESILFAGRIKPNGLAIVTAKELDGVDLSKYLQATKVVSIP